MQLSDFIAFLGLLGLIAVAYSGFVHTRLHDAENKISDLRQHVAESYLAKEVGTKLFEKLEKMDEVLNSIDKTVAIWDDRLERGQM